MDTAFVFKCGTVAVKGMLSAVLAIGLAGPSTGWAQGPSPESLDISDRAQQTVQWERQDIPTDSIQLARAKRPAAKQESPEEAQQKKLPKPVPPGQVKRASKSDLINACNQQPKCRAKMQAAKSGKKPKNRRPAAREESPEEKTFKQLPKPAQQAPGRQQSQNDFLRPVLGNSLFEWLNPFAASEAYAQSSVSVSLTPLSNYISTPYSLLRGYGVVMYSSSYYYLNGYYNISSFSRTENKPYVYSLFRAPASGYYIIDFTGSRNKAKLKHQSNGPIIETWDLLSQSCGQCNYATMEYLEEGYHYFYFYPEGNAALYVYGLDITSYP